MDSRSKTALLTSSVALLFVVGLQVVPEAQAVLGRRAMRTAVVVSAASANKASSEQSQQQTASTQQTQQPTQQQTGTAQPQADAATPAPTPAPAEAKPTSAAAPLGSVVSTLPAGCKPMTKDNIEYQHCGNTYYRTAFQGSDLVYVSAQP